MVHDLAYMHSSLLCMRMHPLNTLPMLCACSGLQALPTAGPICHQANGLPDLVQRLASTYSGTLAVQMDHLELCALAVVLLQLGDRYKTSTGSASFMAAGQIGISLAISACMPQQALRALLWDAADVACFSGRSSSGWLPGWRRHLSCHNSSASASCARSCTQTSWSASWQRNSPGPRCSCCLAGMLLTHAP